MNWHSPLWNLLLNEILPIWAGMLLIAAAMRAINALIRRGEFRKMSSLTLRSPELQERPTKRHKNGNRFAKRAKKATNEPVFQFQRDRVDEPPKTMSDAIRAAVRECPKTNGEVLRYVQAHGFPDVTSSTVSTILCQRRNANEMYKDDATLLWHVAKKP